MHDAKAMQPEQFFRLVRHGAGGQGPETRPIKHACGLHEVHGALREGFTLSVCAERGAETRETLLGTPCRRGIDDFSAMCNEIAHPL